MKWLILSFVMALFAVKVSAQSSWCGTADRAHDRPIRLNSSASKNSQGTVTIPVVIHLFYYTSGGNISDAQIIDGLRVVNEDFNRLNADTANTHPLFSPFAADVGIEFKLAKLDPNGDSTSGILRYDTLLIPHAEPTDPRFNNVKKASAWPAWKYYNIWLVQSIAGGTLGYAQYPGTQFTYGGPWETWGIVVRSDQWGTIGTSSSDGRTGTHEIGHSLGCYHTFLSMTAGCGSACDTTGDEVCDTPPADPSFDCIEKNTCSNDLLGNSPFTADSIDQLDNYMSYNTCQTMFSEGQKERMWGFINEFDTINGLFKVQNLIETGLLPWTVGVENGSRKPSIRLWPNPFQERVTFSSSGGTYMRVCIYDVLGRVVFEQLSKSVVTWEPAHNEKGMFFYTIEDGRRTYSGKVLRK